MSPWVVGIDLSLVSSGVATPTGLHRVRSKGTAKDTLLQRQVRLSRIVAELWPTILSPDGRPDLVVIEGPSMMSKGGHPHDRSGLWWLVVHTLIDQHVPVAVMTPSARCKYGTGKGNAAKDVVLTETVRRYPDFEVNGNDVADALILCAAGMDHLGHPLVELPAIHRAALDKVEWPANLKVTT